MYFCNKEMRHKKILDDGQELVKNDASQTTSLGEQIQSQDSGVHGQNFTYSNSGSNMQHIEKSTRIMKLLENSLNEIFTNFNLTLTKSIEKRLASIQASVNRMQEQVQHTQQVVMKLLLQQQAKVKAVDSSCCSSESIDSDSYVAYVERMQKYQRMLKYQENIDTKHLSLNRSRDMPRGRTTFHNPSGFATI